MAYELSQSLKITLVAAADLTTAQYKFVKVDANGKAALCAAVTDKPVGVLQNTPNTGEEAEIVVDGVSKVIGAAALTAGTSIGTNASALAAAKTIGTDTTHFLAGTVLGATGAANEVATALIACANPGRAV